MAVSVMTMVIPLALYILFQRYIINTFAMSGIRVRELAAKGKSNKEKIK